MHMPIEDKDKERKMLDFFIEKVDHIKLLILDELKKQNFTLETGEAILEDLLKDMRKTPLLVKKFKKFKGKYHL